MPDSLQPTNPYSPPAAPPPTSAEARIRGRLLPKEAALRVLGGFYVMVGLVVLAAWIYLLQASGMTLPILLVLCFLAGIFLHAGFRLSTLKARSRRYLAVFTGVLTLSYVGYLLSEGAKLFRGISWGESKFLTALAYVALMAPTFYVMCSRDGRFILSAEYRKLMVATPGLKFWRTWTAVAALLLILVIASTIVERIER